MIPNGKEMNWNGHHLVFESENDPCRGCFFADKDECPECDEGLWVEENPSPWHTGTPTEDGWYLIKYECLVEGRYKGKLTYRAVHIYYDKYGIYNEDGSIGNDEVWKPIEYQIIEQNKETNNGEKLSRSF